MLPSSASLGTSSTALHRTAAARKQEQQQRQRQRRVGMCRAGWAAEPPSPASKGPTLPALPDMLKKVI
jgi:hypothetical protein